ncbi:hypothetical protein [Leptospira licerasiae]|uniref:Uncharacterized protein n=1 Tax=Leptospira licerasiae str. MMD4847 TaxID=1049971 RepID=A0ABN0HDL9_9LEPT|nr:hypothetical protein [Leptospira licerasiae]EIE03476.1 hypothetical protein LEP1GSC185_3538 [Leptospira licerasiae serovar Varillal str. VAR 010]EJZ43774.1 hypothetical protein LEP1GSC178_2008 [Leptospira licerasiae str. MMD4847]
MPSKIKINNDLWLSTKNNKVVLGSKRFPRGVHLTFNYGGKSGIFDLHFKNEKKEIYASIACFDGKIADEILTILAYKVREFFLTQFKEISLSEFRSKYRYFIEDDHDFELTDKEKVDLEKIFEIQKSKKEIRFNIPKRFERSKLMKLRELLYSRIKKTKRQNILAKSQGRVIDKFGNLSIFMISDGKVLVGKESIFENEDRLLNAILGIDLLTELKKKFIECLSHVSNDEANGNLFDPVQIVIRSD